MADPEDFTAELNDFRKRVAELSSARSLPVDEQLPALDAALFELQHAAEVLWPRHEELAAADRRQGGRRDTDEQQLLRALFQRLPLAVILLDPDCVVRRLNVAATQLFGMRAGYATGRALTASLAHDGRAALRTQVAAVARGEGSRSLPLHLLRQPERNDPESGAMRVTLTALRPPREARTAVLAVFQQMSRGIPRPAVVEAPADETAMERSVTQPDLLELTRHTELLDLVDEMASRLLTAPEDREVLAARAAAVLHERFADWVLLDLADDDGKLRRVTVRSPAGAARKAVADQAPEDSPVVAEVVRTGSEKLQVRPEDPEALGRDVAGTPVIVLAEVTSLLSVPLTPGAAAHAGPEQPDDAGGREEASGSDGRNGADGVPNAAQGALTLLRTGGRRPFELAEAAAAGRMARHLSLALHGHP